jgi:hypothetical protein
MWADFKANKTTSGGRIQKKSNFTSLMSSIGFCHVERGQRNVQIRIESSALGFLSRTQKKRGQRHIKRDKATDKRFVSSITGTKEHFVAKKKNRSPEGVRGQHNGQQQKTLWT